MWSDLVHVSNLRPMALESDALSTALCGLASNYETYDRIFKLMLEKP